MLGGQTFLSKTPTSTLFPAMKHLHNFVKGVISVQGCSCGINKMNWGVWGVTKSLAGCQLILAFYQ